MMNTTIDHDAFGPRLTGSFDFTLYFEQAILSIIPSALFLTISSCRIAWLLRRQSLPHSGWLLWAKLVGWAIAPTWKMMADCLNDRLPLPCMSFCKWLFSHYGQFQPP